MGARGIGRLAMRYVFLLLSPFCFEGMWRRCVFFFSKVRVLRVVVAVGGGAAVVGGGIDAMLAACNVSRVYQCVV